MQIIGDIFNLLFFGPTINLLVLILRGLEFLHIPGALGFSIILLTIIIRLIIWPFMGTQLRSAKKMADLKPHLDVLKQNHGKDKQALAAAQMALYKEHGVNPAGGCLPALIQIPVIWALYQTIFAFFSGQAGLDQINSTLYFPNLHLLSVPNLNFLGLDLAVKPSDFAHYGWFLLLIPLLTALLQFLQSKMMIPKAVKEYPSDSPKEKKEKEGKEDMATSMQSQMMYMMPVMIGYFAFTFPLGVALYWNTLTIMSIFQQYFISGWGGLEDWVQKLSSR